MISQELQAAQVLHHKALGVIENYKRNELELINILQEFDQTKGFLHLKFTSLHDYAVKALRLSSEVAYILISVARKSRAIPELKIAIENKELTANEIRKILPVVTKENKIQWLTMAKEMPQRVLEREVAKANPKAATPEKVKYVTGARLSLSLGMTEDLHKKLKQVQDLESQRLKKPASFEEVLEVMTDIYLAKNDPINKAQRWSQRKSLVVRQVSKAPVSPIPFQRKAISSEISHQLVIRDEGKCSEAGCDQSRWLQVHHVIPISHGGSNHLENLKTLCWAHHKMEHLL